MPRPVTRQRIVYCDCFDCIEQPDNTVRSQAELAAADAVAQQKPPPKAIYLIGSGLLSSQEGVTSLEDCATPHLDRAAREGCLGIAALRKSTALGPLDPCLHELSQILEAHQEVSTLDASIWSDQATVSDLPSLGSRYKGLQVLAASTSPPCRKMLKGVGAALPDDLQLQVHPAASTLADDTQPANSPDPTSAGASSQPGIDAPLQQPEPAWCGQALGLPAPAAYASQLLAALDVTEGHAGADMALVHLNGTDLCQDAASEEQHEAACVGLLWLDALVSQLMTHQQVRERVLLNVLVTSQGRAGHPTDQASGGAHAGTGLAQMQSKPLPASGTMLDPNVLIVTPRDSSAMLKASAAMDALSEVTRHQVPRPLQSWEIRGLERVEIASEAPAVYLRRLPGVVRKDRALKFTLDEAVQKGGMGAMLVDRLMPEMAYKLGRALKYGA